MNFPIAETKELEEFRVSPGLSVFLAALKFHSKLEKKRKEATLRQAELVLAMNGQHKVSSQMMKLWPKFFC